MAIHSNLTAHPRLLLACLGAAQRWLLLPRPSRPSPHLAALPAVGVHTRAAAAPWVGKCDGTPCSWRLWSAAAGRRTQHPVLWSHKHCCYVAHMRPAAQITASDCCGSTVLRAFITMCWSALKAGRCATNHAFYLSA
jgi:hypothetical protein